jgi:hypothetical protein
VSRTSTSPVEALALVMAGALLVAACGFSRDRTLAEQDSDASAIAAALDRADRDGAEFSMDDTLVTTGGEIPRGRQISWQATLKGRVKDGRAYMTYTSTQQRTTYTIVVAEGLIYIRKGSGPWQASDASAMVTIYPALRLSLLKQSVLLAKSISGASAQHTNAGFGNSYEVVPAKDQLEQLAAVSPTTANEALFLSLATAKLQFVISTSGSNLYRSEVHLNTTDPVTGVVQAVDSVVDFKLTGKVRAIDVPSDAVPVDPSQIRFQ